MAKELDKDWELHMNKPEISVIVPVYNVEAYLKICIDSILGQTLKNIEIILVDDGSTDNSGIICDEYSKVDDRIKVFHKENGGISSARNYGLERATADYIGFVDSDDYISEKMYEVLYNIISREKADMSMCYVNQVFGGHIDNDLVTDKIQYQVFDSEEAIKRTFYGNDFTVIANNKLYRKNLFDKVKYPLGKFAEDAFVIVELFDLCNKIAVTNERLYYYVMRDSSITHVISNSMRDIFEAYQHNYNIIKEKYPNIIDCAEFRIVWSYYYILDKIILTDSNEYYELENECVENVRKHFLFVLRYSGYTKERRLSLIVLMFSRNLYKICVRKQHKRDTARYYRKGQQ